MESDSYNSANNAYIIEGSIFDYSGTSDEPLENSPLGRFGRKTGGAGTEIDLAEAALLMAAQEYAGLNEAYYLDELDKLADEVRPLISVLNDPLKSIEQLNYFLTTLKGFHGNETEYSDRRNSFLNDVLERRTGLPITLSLLYIELGKRLGLHFEGIGLPGHFIIRYRELAPQALLGRSERAGLPLEDENIERQEDIGRSLFGQEGDILLDPFNGGQILTEEECVELVRERYGRVAGIRQAFLRPVTNHQFLTRMLNNIKASCIGEQDFGQALAFQEFLVVLNPGSADEKRDRAELNLRNKRPGRAIVDFQTYLRQAPDARDARLVRAHLKEAFDQLVSRN